MTPKIEGVPTHFLPFADRRDSLVGSIASGLAGDIIEGRLRPGDELNSVELARRFSASRTPIREALFLLEKEALIEIPQRRRARVASMTMAEIREIYFVRAGLFALVAELIVTIASDEQIQSLEEIYRHMAEAASRHDLAAYFWANVGFHERSAEICSNRTLKRILDSLGLRTLQLRHLGLAQPNRMEESCADHGRLLRAYKERDARLAAEVTRSNVIGGLKAIENSGWTGTREAHAMKRRVRLRVV